MLSLLFTGMLTSEPEHRVDRRTRPIVTARMTAIDAEGAVIGVSVVAFDRSACAALGGLKVGDEVAIAGHASINRWEKDGHQHVGLNVKATRVLTIHDAGIHLMPRVRSPLQGLA